MYSASWASNKELLIQNRLGLAAVNTLQGRQQGHSYLLSYCHINGGVSRLILHSEHLQSGFVFRNTLLDGSIYFTFRLHTCSCFWHWGTHYITLHEQYIKISCLWLMSVTMCSYVLCTWQDEFRIRGRTATENIVGACSLALSVSPSLNVFIFSVIWQLKHTFCLVVQQPVGLGAGRHSGNKTWQSVEQINRYLLHGAECFLSS